MEESFPSSMISDTDKLALTVLFEKRLNLVPVFDDELGYKYPEAEALFEMPHRKILEKLNSLSKMGYLNKNLCATILKCPKCNDYKLRLRLQCPYCCSFRLAKGVSMKHYPCGYVGFEEEFLEQNRYVCPKCHTPLEKLGIDHMKVGTWYRCVDCGKTFGEPKELIYCSVCDKGFEREELVLEPIYSFAINEENVQEVLLDIDLSAIKKVFSDRWVVEMPAKVVGESEVPHLFTAALTSKGPVGKRVLMDVDYATTHVTTDAVMRFFAKVADVKPDMAILVGIPKFDEGAKKLAETYRIKVLEAKRFVHVLDRLDKCLNEISREDVMGDE
jgi:hypothetical protein